MESYIEDKKYLYTSIHEFLEESDEHKDDKISNESYKKLINVIKSQQIEGDVEEIRQFLKIIKRIGKHHHRDQHFNERINQLLLHYKDQIKQTLSNSEIFHIFESNKKITLFLLKEEIITISDEICKVMISKLENNGNRYCHFFIPELENFLGEEKLKSIKNELLNEDPNFFTNYEEKRQEGENDLYICSLIRQDSVEEFISYVNRYNISLNSEISPSIFETNPFLIDNNDTTLIKYAAFFGSIQIFQYMLMNNAILTQSLCLYAIHSKNAEMIHLLESNKVIPSVSMNIRSSYYNIFELCLIESIKCHHNDIADYIENNYFYQTGKDLEQNKENILNCLKYHNYKYLQNDNIIDHCFFSLCFYHYDKLAELCFKKKEKMIENKIIQYPDIRTASMKNELEVIYHYLLKMETIPKGLFNETKIQQISIPSSITSIGNYAFKDCTSLIQISIPSSVTSIGCNAFEGCISLSQISIPFSVTSIGYNAFTKCSSLTQIKIPSSVTSIGYYAFARCTSLRQITISSSVTSIGDSSFFKCISLRQISIPFSVTSIGDNAFFKCSRLEQITIPSSVTSIGDSAFSGCSSLTQILIPSSVTIIGKSAFYGCSSLKQVTIPSSVTVIGDYAFAYCSKSITFTIIPCEKKIIEFYDNQFLLIKSNSNSEIYDTLLWVEPKIKSAIIPEFITKIANASFINRLLLEWVIIPSSVTSIGKSAFSGCSSLREIIIPSSVTSIGENAFSGCSSLTQIEIPKSIKKKHLGLNPPEPNPRQYFDYFFDMDPFD